MSEGGNIPQAEKILKVVDDCRIELVDFLAEMIRIPSENPDYLGVDREKVLGGETQVNKFLKTAEEDFGCQTDMWAEAPERENLVGVLKGTGGGRSLMFNGHVDTVPVLDPAKWEGSDPFSGKVKDNQIYGRGSCDMKGGIAAFVKAAEFVKRAGIKLKGDLILATVVGEEVMEHDLGTTASIKRGYTADAAVVAEPTSYRGKMTICPTSPGALAMTLTCKGKSTHNSVRFELVRAGRGGDAIGVSAIEKGAKVLAGMQELERQWGFSKKHPLFPDGYFVIHPGVIHGGPTGIEIPYIVSDYCAVKYVVWYPPDEDPQDIRDEVETYVRDFIQTDPWLRQNPPEIDWWLEWPAYEVDTESPLSQMTKNAYTLATGRDIDFQSFLSVCDASFLEAQGIKALTFGPGDLLNAHTINEHLDVDELIQICKAYALMMVDWCGAE